MLFKIITFWFWIDQKTSKKQNPYFACHSLILTFNSLSISFKFSVNHVELFTFLKLRGFSSRVFRCDFSSEYDWLPQKLKSFDWLKYVIQWSPRVFYLENALRSSNNKIVQEAPTFIFVWKVERIGWSL